MSEEIRFKKEKGYTHCWNVQKKNKLFGFEFWYNYDSFDTINSNPSYEDLTNAYAFENRRRKGDIRFYPRGDYEYGVEVKTSFLGFESWKRKGTVSVSKKVPTVEDLVYAFSFKNSSKIVSSKT